MSPLFAVLLVLASVGDARHTPPRVTPVASPSAANPNYPRSAASLGAHKALR